MSGSNPFNPRLTDWDVSFGGYSLGLVNAVHPDLTLKMKEIRRGTLGDIVIGDFLQGMSGSIKIEVPDIAPGVILAMMPWATAATDQILASSTPGDNLYGYAGLLTLHPHDLAAANTTEDVNYVKAAPMSAFSLKRDGDNETSWEVVFKLYPDLSKLQATTPKIIYGFLGPVPSGGI